MGGKKLLVADDSVTIQKIVHLVLSTEGYEIRFASDGAEVMEQIATFQPDAVLIDISLPKKNAFEIKKEYDRQKAGSARFILMSSSFENVDEAEASRLGFSGRITKPFDPGQLRDILVSPGASSSVRIEEDFPPPPPVPPGSTNTQIPRPPSFGREEPSLHADPDLVSHPHITRLDLGPPASPPSNLKLEIEEFKFSPSSETPSSTPPSENFGEWEIKHLTDSTLDNKPSQVDDFDWKIQDTGSFVPPPAKPLPPSPAFRDDGGTSFRLEKPSARESREPPAASPPSGLESNVGFEEVIRDEVERRLQEMVKEVIPEIAERVIREKIDQILREEG